MSARTTAFAPQKHVFWATGSCSRNSGLSRTCWVHSDTRKKVRFFKINDFYRILNAFFWTTYWQNVAWDTESNRTVSCVCFSDFQQKNHAYTLNSKYLVYGCDSLILRDTRRTLGILFTFFLEKHDAWFNFGQPRAKSFIMYLPTYNLYQMSKIYFLDLLETLQNNLIKKMTKFCPKGLFWSFDIMQPAYKSYI